MPLPDPILSPISERELILVRETEVPAERWGQDTVSGGGNRIHGHRINGGPIVDRDHNTFSGQGQLGLQGRATGIPDLQPAIGMGKLAVLCCESDACSTFQCWAKRCLYGKGDRQCAASTRSLRYDEILAEALVRKHIFNIHVGTFPKYRRPLTGLLVWMPWGYG